MSQPLAIGDRVTAPAAAHEHAPVPDPRRRLQLALAVLWLLDAMLQFQPFMFGHGFGQMLAGSAPGNPAILARPVIWSAVLVGHHAAVLKCLGGIFTGSATDLNSAPLLALRPSPSGPPPRPSRPSRPSHPPPR